MMRSYLLLALLMGGAAAHATGPIARVGASDALCQACLVTVHAVEDALVNPHTTAFMVLLMEQHVCPLLEDSIKCHNIAAGLVPVLVEYIRTSATPETVCATTGVCLAPVAYSARAAMVKTSVAATDESTVCTICTFALTELKRTFDDLHIETEALAAALKVCAKLPADLTEACIKLVNTYEPVIVSFLANLKPDEVCLMVRACRPDTPPTASFKPLPASTTRFMSALMRIAPAGLMVAPAGLVAPSNDACDMCKASLLQAHDLVANPAVQEDLTNYLLQACESIPTLTESCQANVALYAPLVYTLLESVLVGDKLCVQVGICTSVAPPLGQMLASARRMAELEAKQV